MSRLLAVCTALGLAACTVGPDYKGPPGQHLSGRSFARQGVVPVVAEPLAARWWIALGDPLLDRLETDALRDSPDLAAAGARLRQSRAQLAAKQAELRPTTSTSALYLHTHGGDGLLSGLTSGSGAEAEEEEAALSSSSSSDLDFYDAGFDATWEIDLFGGRRRAIQAAAASAEAQGASLADTRVSLAADVAQAYVSFRDLQRRIALSDDSAALQQRMLDLTRQRAGAGTASALDVERLQGQLDQTRADRVPLDAQADAERDRLSVLTGRLPGSLDTVLATPAPVPLPPPQVAIGDPAGLIRRRPDIREAERQIAAQTAGIGQHLADYFPKLQLLGNVGFSSTDIGTLFEGGSFSAVAAPVLSWKPFDFGRTAAAVRQARAGRDEAVAHYRSVVLSALGDAETALSRYGHQRQAVAAIARTRLSDERAASLTRQRFAAGTTTLIDLLDTERQRVAAELALAQAEAEMTRDFVSLQKSLGLGWQSPHDGTAG